jgi:hypothetical protein
MMVTSLHHQHWATIQQILHHLIVFGTIKSTTTANGQGYRCMDGPLPPAAPVLELLGNHNVSTLLQWIPIEPPIEAAVVHLSPICKGGMNVFLDGIKIFREVTCLNSSYISQSQARPETLPLFDRGTAEREKKDGSSTSKKTTHP